MIYPKRQKREPMGVRGRPQIRCNAHLQYIRLFQCSIIGKLDHVCSGRVEAAHVRRGTDGGTSVKPSDIWTIPLCSDAHAEQHRIGEAAFEKRYGINMKAIAEAHASRSPHHSKWKDRAS